MIIIKAEHTVDNGSRSGVTISELTICFLIGKAFIFKLRLRYINCHWSNVVRDTSRDVHII